MDISEIDFGAPAAERDIQRGLNDYFLESDAYARVSSGKKTLLLGNRGTGKSAIFKIFAQRERKEGSIVLELAPEDYSYEILQSTLKREDEGSWAKHSAFTAAWKFLILIMIMKALTSSGPKLKTGPAASIYNFLRDNHKGVQDSPISMLISYLKRIEGFKIGSYEAGIKTRSLAGLYKLEELDPYIPYIKQMCKKKKVIVLVDELDRGWDNSEDAQSFVAGLVQAAMSLNELSENMIIAVSLRQELYDNIPELYDDAQKYRDVIEVIRWDETKLLALIANRIRHSSKGEFDQVPDDDCWNKVFVETLQYRQTKSFNYMVDRTLYRPRELIQFCTDVLDNKEADNNPLDYNVITHAELMYSEARVKDIASEFRFQYPGLLSIFEVFRGKTYAFDREDLEMLCLEIVEGDVRTEASARQWLDGQDHDLLIDILWKIGFLRAQAVGGIKAMRRSGSSYLGPHQVTHLNLSSLTRFQVHPMFRAYLGMKESK